MYNIIGTAVAESNRMAYRELLALAARNVFELFKSIASEYKVVADYCSIKHQVKKHLSDLNCLENCFHVIRLCRRAIFKETFAYW